ncbi:redoxin domain-containing protein [Isosphaeraceae bacterium EP7]
MSSRRAMLHLSQLFSIALACCAGCSSTRGLRPEVVTTAPDGISTVASIGDSPLPAVSGEPGLSVTADRSPLEANTPRGDRISGRVVDEQGSPLEGVRVRVADGSVQGGRVKETKTDRAGGFTIRGLETGETYTLLADTEDGERRFGGRIEANAPESGVRISLREVRSVHSGKSIKRASEASEPDPEVSVEESDIIDDSVMANDEDLPPARRTRVARRESDEDVPPQADAETVNAWRKGAAEVLDRKDAEDQGQSRRVSSPDPDPILPDDEPEEVAPPARSEATTPKRPDAEETALIERAFRTSSKAPPPQVVPVAEVKVAELPVPEPTAPPSVADATPDEDVSPDKSLAVAKPEPTADPVVLANFPASESDVETERQRPSWGELPKPVAKPSTKLASGTKPPIKIAEGPAPTEITGLPTPVATVGPKPVSTRRRFGFARAGAKGKPSPQAGTTTAAIDPNNQRIVNFSLPNLEGQTVQFKDFDSDLILIDFWGTWCAPCLESIPRLAALQKRYGPKTLQVVGIACEKGPIDSRAKNVAAVAKKLGVNYSVLLDDAEVPSKIQDLLHIQVYPTMVLVNRSGVILWRDSGATPMNLARLEHAIELAGTRSSVASTLP